MPSEVIMIDGSRAHVQYDTGSQTSLVTSSFIKSLGLTKFGRLCEMKIRCSVSGQSVTAMKVHKLHFKVGMRVVAAQVFEVEHIGHLPFPPDSEVLEEIFPAEARCEPSGKWACGQGEVDVLLAADSLNLFPR